MASIADDSISALSSAADHADIGTMGGATAGNRGALLPAASQATNASAAGCVSCDGVTFTVTEGNKVAEVVGSGGAARVLPSESFLDEGTGTRYHFVDVQTEAAAMLFLVSVQEDQRRILAIKRLF